MHCRNRIAKKLSLENASKLMSRMDGGLPVSYYFGYTAPQVLMPELAFP
jgi:hypothetical protein